MLIDVSHVLIYLCTTHVQHRLGIHADTYMSMGMHAYFSIHVCVHTHTLLQFECICIFTIGTLQITPI